MRVTTQFCHSAVTRFIGVMALVALSACAEKTVPASVRGYSHHIESPIYNFTVNGAMGSTMGTNGSGGSSCCVAIPARWRVGLVASVNVEYDSEQGGPPPPPPRTFEVPIESYTEQDLGDLHVHFYPRGKVRIVVSPYSPGHPKFPPMEGVSPDWAWYRNYCREALADPVCKTIPNAHRQ